MHFRPSHRKQQGDARGVGRNWLRSDAVACPRHRWIACRTCDVTAFSIKAASKAQGNTRKINDAIFFKLFFLKKKHCVDFFFKKKHCVDFFFKKKHCVDFFLALKKNTFSILGDASPRALLRPRALYPSTLPNFTAGVRRVGLAQPCRPILQEFHADNSLHSDISPLNQNISCK